MKRCCNCKKLKEEDEFYLYTCGVKRFNDCRECISIKTAVRKKKIYAWVDDYKSAMGCEVCGETDKRCLQLHHRKSSNKKKSVAALIGKGYVFKTVKAEVGKCEVLCANCHSIHHYDDRRSGSWGAGQYDYEAPEQESEPMAEQLKLFLNFVEE